MDPWRGWGRDFSENILGGSAGGGSDRVDNGEAVCLDPGQKVKADLPHGSDTFQPGYKDQKYEGGFRRAGREALWAGRDAGVEKLSRDRKKYRTTVVSLTLSIVLFVTAGSFVQYLTAAGDEVFRSTDMDIWLSLSDLVSGSGEEQKEKAMEELKQIEGISEIRPRTACPCRRYFPGSFCRKLRLCTARNVRMEGGSLAVM